MKVRGIKNTRAASLSKQCPNRSQSSVGYETHLWISRLRARISPNPNIRIVKMRHQRLEVDCDAAIRRRQWPKEYNSLAHLEA